MLLLNLETRVKLNDYIFAEIDQIDCFVKLDDKHRFVKTSQKIWGFYRNVISYNLYGSQIFFSNIRQNYLKIKSVMKKVGTSTKVPNNYGENFSK